jgi:hypothetical protein
MNSNTSEYIADVLQHEVKDVLVMTGESKARRPTGSSIIARVSSATSASMANSMEIAAIASPATPCDDPRCCGRVAERASIAPLHVIYHTI